MIKPGSKCLQDETKSFPKKLTNYKATNLAVQKLLLCVQCWCPHVVCVPATESSVLVQLFWGLRDINGPCDRRGPVLPGQRAEVELQVTLQVFRGGCVSLQAWSWILNTQTIKIISHCQTHHVSGTQTEWEALQRFWVGLQEKVQAELQGLWSWDHQGQWLFHSVAPLHWPPLLGETGLQPRPEKKQWSEIHRIKIRMIHVDVVVEWKCSVVTGGPVRSALARVVGM